MRSVTVILTESGIIVAAYECRATAESEADKRNVEARYATSDAEATPYRTQTLYPHPAKKPEQISLQLAP